LKEKKKINCSEIKQEQMIQRTSKVEFE